MHVLYNPIYMGWSWHFWYTVISVCCAAFLFSKASYLWWGLLDDEAVRMVKVYI